MANISADQMAEFERLAQVARPIDDDDWGTQRQIEAENAFFSAVGLDKNEHALGKRFWDWSLKATTDEALDEALRLLRLRVAQ